MHFVPKQGNTTATAVVGLSQDALHRPTTPKSLAFQDFAEFRNLLDFSRIR